MGDAHDRSESDPGRSVWSRRVPWVLLLGGMALSVVLALAWRSTLQERNQQAFSVSAERVQEVVSTQVARQSDLLSTMEGLVASDPDISNVFLGDWYDRARIPERFPGSVGISFVVPVPAADLPAFARTMAADPIEGLSDPGPLTVVPEGTRSGYCLQRLAVLETNRIEGFVIPAGLDFCASELPGAGPSPLPAALEQATSRDSPAVFSIGVENQAVFGAFKAVYSDGVVPSTTAEREAGPLGWVGATFDAHTIVDPVAKEGTNIQVEVFASTAAGEALLATGGEVGPGPVSTVELPASSDGTWRVRVSQVAGVGGPSPDTQGLLVFAAGLLISALLFALVRLLSASRDHAMRLVDEKTAELEFLAMHDGLTGLPNRALLLDRATQMLAKQARTSSTAVALFVDLDNFKAVNDTLGHAAGDDYLRTVAGRIENVLRDTDTVGRLGGDEFVVLVEDDETLQRADLIAERIVEVLSEPIEIEDMAVPVSCSIGVAYATDDDAEALIQNADVAMYEAKADGKSRYRVFTREMHDAAADRLTPGSR